MMENKTGPSIEPVIQNWPLSKIAFNVLRILAPAAFLAIFLSYPAEIRDFLFSSRPPDPTRRYLNRPWYYLHYWLGQWLRIKKNPGNIVKPLNACDVWEDGSLLCTFVNLAVPGACKDPREHRLKTPKHGQKIVFEYMNILPIFTSKELTQKSLNYSQEQKFDQYLDKIHSMVLQQIDRFNAMKFSTDYVARGMGLVVGQQNKKSTFYIYPIPKKQQYICDVVIEINGPCGNKGRIVVPSLLQHNSKWQPPTDYQRALYMSSKLNSISPTVQGSSFLRRLSLPSHGVTTDDELDIQVKVTSTRAKITYRPQRIGVYEINLMTGECHLVGSPYTIPVEVSDNNLNDSDKDSDDEREERYIKRKKKIITRIVDFIDKKMSLPNEETIVKKNEIKSVVPEEEIKISRLYQINLLTPDLLEMNTTESVPLIQNAFNQNLNNQISPALASKVDVPSLEDQMQSNISLNNNVDNLVKVFDNPKGSSPILNDPDLVKCHIEKADNFLRPTKNTLQDKLMKMGAISSKFDIKQCNLKTNLIIELQNRIEVQNDFEEYSPGFVKRQKLFWQEKNKNITGVNVMKLKIKSSSPEKIKLLVDVYNSNNKNDIYNKDNSQSLEPLKGIVKNTRQLFENPTAGSENKKLINLSLNHIKDLNEENMNVPSLQERKDKFLEACQNDENIFEKDSQIYNQKENEINYICLKEKEDFVDVKPIYIQPQVINQNVNIFEYSSKSKQPNKHSLRRKSRFKRAKLFFQNLETSASESDLTLSDKNSPVINYNYQNSEEEIFNNKELSNISSFSNSENNLTEFEFETEKENSKNQTNVFKTSDRFLVDDLFKDILDDRRFIGVPNKLAMAASLASLNSSFDEEKYDDLLENREQRDLNYFAKNDHKNLSSSEENIPGFHKEYPHPPLTMRWKPKSRIRTKKREEDSNELIPGKVLLKKNNTYA